VEIARDTDLSFQESEESVLGVTHTEIGGWLAERWNLPDHLVEAIKLHHSPTSAQRNKDLVAIIHAADVFACRMSETRAEFDKGTDFDAEGLAQINLNDESLIQEYLARYTSIVQSDVANVMQLDQ
jgi:HD-like signal output (HDOD) protein